MDFIRAPMEENIGHLYQLRTLVEGLFITMKSMLILSMRTGFGICIPMFPRVKTADAHLKPFLIMAKAFIRIIMHSGFIRTIRII